MASEETWEDDIKPSIPQKIKSAFTNLFTLKKGSSDKIKKKKIKTEVKIQETVEPVKETPVEISSEKPEEPVELKQKDKKHKIKRNKDEEWQKEGSERPNFIPQLDRSLPGTFVIKRILAFVLIIINIAGVIYVTRTETSATILLLLISFILIDYLVITSPNKNEKWVE